MTISDQQKRAVLALPGPQRYEHFVKQVADRQQVWGLYSDGWALAAGPDGTRVFLFWPAEEYAKACATEHWAGYEPEALDLDEFLDLLTSLEADGVMPGIFYTPGDKGVTPSVRELRERLEEELRRYE